MARRSDLSEAMHASASRPHELGVPDKATMRDFDPCRLAVPGEIAPARIEQLREADNVRQPVFVRDLKTSESTVEKWETGAKRPSGMALKLLAVVRKHGLQVLA